jgi:uncharacterized protein
MISEADALFTKTQQRVFGLLFGRPDQRFHANEIVRQVGMGRGTVRRELERLSAAGLLTRVQDGNQHHYQANSASPIYAELVSITRKTFGLADVLREGLQSLGNSLQLAFIFGSMAKGGATIESDIDLMLVGDDLAYGDIIRLLQPLEEALRRKINPTLYSTHEFNNKLSARQSFLERVVNAPRIMIKGMTDDFGKPRADPATQGGKA